MPGSAQHAAHRRKYFLSDLATQFNVHPAACHVRGDGHCAKSARACNDLAFLRMLARIKYMMGHAAFDDFHQAFCMLVLEIQNSQEASQIVFLLQVEGYIQFAR